MAGRVRVNGENFDILGGRVRVNGENFDILSGRARVDGQVQTISFSKSLTLKGDMALNRAHIILNDEIITDELIDFPIYDTDYLEVYVGGNSNSKLYFNSNIVATGITTQEINISNYNSIEINFSDFGSYVYCFIDTN